MPKPGYALACRRDCIQLVCVNSERTNRFWRLAMRMLLKKLSQHTPVRTAFHHPGSNRIQINLSIIMIGFRHLQIYQPLSDSSLFYVYSLMDKFRLDQGLQGIKKKLLIYF
jgi:hypothetical protein